MTPGIHPRIDSKILIKKSAPQPVLKNTANGGRKSARKYRQTSDYSGTELVRGTKRRGGRAATYGAGRRRSHYERLSVCGCAGIF
jgi:hypothetical protein